MMSGSTVLMLAADSHLFRKLGWVLGHRGCKVLRLSSEALELEATQVRELDLVLAQIKREDGGELAVLKQIKTLHPQVRLILCSRHGETAFPLEAYQMEVDDYLLMPLSLVELWRRVAACLEGAAGRTWDLALKSGGRPLNRAILEKSRPVGEYFRYNLGVSASALKSLIHISASSLDQKLMAQIQEVSARLEVLQEMTEGFLWGISGAEYVAGLLTERNSGPPAMRHG
jgi:DNA-binding NtrC family response regulator